MSLANHNLSNMPALLDKMDRYFGDVEEESTLDFPEFAGFMRNFLPDASEDQLDQMFNNIDGRGLSTITKKQLMDSAFFTEFLRTSDKMFSMREQELMNQQQTELIGQLQDYVNTIGRPAEFENERLKQEVRDLKEENRFLERQNEALHEEVASLQAFEQSHQDEIEMLRQEKEDQLHEIRELHMQAVESAESSNELRLIQKDLEVEQQKSRELQDTIRQLADANREAECQVRQLSRERKKMEMENDRLRDRADRLSEELAQCSDQWKVERVRADTLAEAVVILESSLDDKDEQLQERERERMSLAPTPTMRINSDGFVLDGLSVVNDGTMTDNDAEEDDLFTQIEQDSTVVLTVPVSVFEATPEPTPTPRPELRRVVRKAKNYAHKRSKSAYIPLVTPRAGNCGSVAHHVRGASSSISNILMVPAPVKDSPRDFEMVKPSAESLNAIQQIVSREIQGVGDKIVESLRPQAEAQSSGNEEILAALARLESEMTTLKRNVGNKRKSPRYGRRSSSEEPKWASQMKQEIVGNNERTMSRLLDEVKDSPQAQGWGCFWPWFSSVGNEYTRLNGS